jgi:ubiquinone/menaquinone biosynthesis C-methylase UbiE
MTTNLERYQRIAPLYDLLDLPFEYRRYRGIRPQLFHGLSGHLLDAGVGTGRNFPFYPPGSDVVGIDLSPAMLSRAARRVRLSAASIELKQMDVTNLGFPDGSFDAAVSSFLFCVLPDELQVGALRELGRAVKPGGVIRCACPWNQPNPARIECTATACPVASTFGGPCPRNPASGVSPPDTTTKGVPPLDT